MNNIIKLNLLIRKILEESLRQTYHFKDRMYDRLFSSFTNFSKEKESIKNLLFDRIQYITSLNFPPKYHIGIRTLKGSIEYFYNNPSKNEESKGSVIWIIAKDNEIMTIVFYDKSTQPNNKDFNISFENLYDYVENYKNGDKNLSVQDIKNIALNNFRKDTKPEITNKESENLLVLNIGGVKWIYDIAKDLLIKKNNPTTTVPFNSLDNVVQDKILSLLEESKKARKKRAL